MATASWLSVSVLIAALTTTGNAQADVRIYEGNLVAGMLTTAHPKTDDGIYHQHYLYEGRAGERVRVSASAPRMEVAVALYAPGGQGDPLADHGGAWTEDDEWMAYVAATLPTSGQYVICVHSHRAGSTGEYDVYVTSRPAAASAAPAPRPSCTAQGDGFAANEAWYINNAYITVNYRSYEKYGLPRVLNAGEVKRFASVGAVGVYVEPSANPMRPVIIYVPVRGCEFQPYQER